MSYIANSVNPDGVRAQEIIESLTEDIQEELGHAQQFAARIKELYGVVPGSLDFTRRAGLPAAARAPDRHRPRHQGRHRGRDRRHRALQPHHPRRPRRSTRSPRTWSSPSCATRRATGASSRAICASTRPRGWHSDASPRREEGHQARAPVRGRQGVGQGARRLGVARRGDRGAHGEQGARALAASRRRPRAPRRRTSPRAGAAGLRSARAARAGARASSSTTRPGTSASRAARR